jgi:hypothetical protein
MTIAGSGLGILLLASTSAAQVPPQQTDPLASERAHVRALLTSADPTNQAWGAWIGGRDTLREMVPLIQNVVATKSVIGGLADQAALDISLDALIQLGATADSRLLAQLYDRRPAQTLILLSQSNAESGDVLMEIVARASGAPWFAAANLLLARRAPGFAAALLSDVALTVTISVSHDGTVGLSAGTGIFGVSSACGASMGIAPGLPPWPYYRLSMLPQAGDVVLALGPKPVYYRRFVASAGTTPAFGDSSISGPTIDDRLTYLAALGRIEPTSMPVRAHESHTIRWQGDAALSDQIARIRDDVVQRARVLVHSLVAAGAMTNEEASAIGDLRITIVVRDARGDVSIK